MAVLQMRSRAAETAADFDHPVALLCACHERVRHFAGLVPKIAARLTSGAPDQATREAAEGVLRYFDVAAQLHHQDEEEDIFPALRAVLRNAADATLAAAMDRLEAEHRALAAAYAAIRPSLTALAAGEPAILTQAQAERFAVLYPAHADAEEREVFAVLESRLGQSTLAAIGRKMAQRRGVRHA